MFEAATVNFFYEQKKIRINFLKKEEENEKIDISKIKLVKEQFSVFLIYQVDEKNENISWISSGECMVPKDGKISFILSPKLDWKRGLTQKVYEAILNNKCKVYWQDSKLDKNVVYFVMEIIK